MDQPRRLVLASGSRYRKALLARLGLAFETVSPEVDETELAGESPAMTALRLAVAKAKAAAARHPDALIVGSDQVASCEGIRLGKPGNHAAARRQLAALSGKAAMFDTALALLDSRSALVRSRVVSCEVAFRVLPETTILEYLAREQPFDCAGSARSEGLGIALIERLRTDDPTSLIGLPLIALTELLAEAGMPVLG
jgi:septum formation protein